MGPTRECFQVGRQELLLDAIELRIPAPVTGVLVIAFLLNEGTTGNLHRFGFRRPALLFIWRHLKRNALSGLPFPWVSFTI